MDTATTLLTLGGLFLAGLAADVLGRATRLPRVTMLLLCGIVAGEAGLGLIPEAAAAWFELLSIVALTMVAFLLGGELTRARLAAHGRAILWVSIAVVLVTVIVVSAGLMALGLAPGLALILGAIATATAPAAMQDVIHQSGRDTGFTRTLSGIVAIDDAWGLFVFGLALVFAHQAGGGTVHVGAAFFELFGAVFLGLAIGVPAALLTGRLSPGEPMQTEALGVVLLIAGAAIWLNVSFLVAGMVAGTWVANFARHHDRPFHEIEHVQWPFMMLFFLLAGATLELEALREVGVFAAAYMVLRVVARLAGGWIGAALAGVPRETRGWYGPALMPQAGVAVGMALVAGEMFPDWAETIMAVTIAATVVFELLGPPVTQLAIKRVGEG